MMLSNSYASVMIDRSDVLESTLRRTLADVEWPVRYGVVSVTIRDGKPTVVKIEETIKLD